MKKGNSGHGRAPRQEPEGIQWDIIRVIVMRRAHRLMGDQYEHAFDCAGEFVLKFFKEPRLQETPISDATRLWLNLQAALHIWRYDAKIRRLRNHELLNNECQDGDVEAVVYDIASGQLDPLQEVICSETEKEFKYAAERLSKAQRKILWEIVVEEKTIRELAKETGKNPATLSSSLYDAKRSIQVILEKSNLTVAEFKQVLNEMDRPRG